VLTTFNIEYPNVVVLNADHLGGGSTSSSRTPSIPLTKNRHFNTRVNKSFGTSIGFTADSLIICTVDKGLKYGLLELETYGKQTTVI